MATKKTAKEKVEEKPIVIEASQEDVKSPSKAVKLPDLENTSEGKVFLDGVDTRYAS